MLWKHSAYLFQSETSWENNVPIHELFSRSCSFPQLEFGVKPWLQSFCWGIVCAILSHPSPEIARLLPEKDSFSYVRSRFTLTFNSRFFQKNISLMIQGLLFLTVQSNLGWRPEHSGELGSKCAHSFSSWHSASSVHCLLAAMDGTFTLLQLATDGALFFQRSVKHQHSTATSQAASCE